MKVSVLFDYDASSLFCSSLMIFYTTMFWFNSQFKDERCFLCTHDAHDCNICRAVFFYSMIVIHWAEKYIMKERCTQWEDRMWLYWVTLFFSWFDLCHIDIEWTDNKIHLFMMSTTNLLILFCVWIEVRRVKRFQFNAIWTMLECCVSEKVNRAEFSPTRQHSL